MQSIICLWRIFNILGYLSDTQQDAVKKVLNGGVAIVTGGPGVGKTTITQAIINLAEADKDIALLPLQAGCKKTCKLCPT